MELGKCIRFEKENARKVYIHISESKKAKKNKDETN
jgi:hypothetical protein